MKPGTKYSLLVVALLLIPAMHPELLAQCAMCKQAAETSLKHDPNSMARSLNTGIIYLMIVPYLMIMFIFRKQIVKLVRGLFNKSLEN